MLIVFCSVCNNKQYFVDKFKTLITITIFISFKKILIFGGAIHFTDMKFRCGVQNFLVKIILFSNMRRGIIEFLLF